MPVPSRRDLYRKMKKRGGPILPMPGMRKAVSERYKERTGRIHEYLTERSARLNKDCDSCGIKPAKEYNSYCVYMDPWSESCTEFNFCSEECMNNFSTEFFECSVCDRAIMLTGPDGMTGMYRFIEDEYGGEMMLCLSCYEKELVDKGVLALHPEMVEENNLPGMFNLDTEGYIEHASYFVRGRDGVKRVVDEIVKLDKLGYKALIEYDNLSIVGDEGYVTLFKKRK